MKSTQTVILIIVLIGLVAGSTFLGQWITTKPPDDAAGVDNVVPEVELTFPVRQAPGPHESELSFPGHYDFWFENNNPYTVEVSLDKKSCKCTQVQLLNLQPEEVSKCATQYPRAAVGPLHAPVAGLLSVLGLTAAVQAEGHGFLGPSSNWQSLMDEQERDKAFVPVPPGGKGLVRMTWKGRKLGPDLLAVQLWVQEQGKPATRTSNTAGRLDVPVNFVVPIMVQPETMKLPEDMRANSQYTLEGYCWSPTRPDLRVWVDQDSSNPCVRIACRELTGADFQNAAAVIWQKAMSRPLVCYHLHATVSERVAGGKFQMDLGPFKIPVALKTNQADSPPAEMIITGLVRGDITVGTEDERERDKIVLRSFSVAKGTTVNVPVTSTQPGLKLALDSWEPPYLEVKLEDNKGGSSVSQWILKATVPPNHTPGKLPAESVVILKTEGPSPRKIRIPVMGRATVP